MAYRRTRPTSLRVSPPSTPQSSTPYLRELTRHVLAGNPTGPAPTPYLSAYPPALNAFTSLLAVTPSDARLFRAAVNPPSAARLAYALPAKEAAALSFVYAVAAVPSRVPLHLRAAQKALSPERAQAVALVASFGGLYATLCALLGLEDSSPETNLSDVTESISGLAPQSNSLSDPDPDDRDSATYSGTSLTSRLAAAARSQLKGRITAPMRLRRAARNVFRAQKASWLKSVPNTKRSQDDFVRAAMGFAPRYLSSIKTASTRAVFVYIIDEILLRDSEHGLSTAIKNLGCYILARAAENPVLTAHSAFLANRFGANDRQLTVCMDVSHLETLSRLYEERNRAAQGSYSSSLATSSSCASTPPRSPPPWYDERGSFRKRCRSSPPFEDRDNPLKSSIFNRDACDEDNNTDMGDTGTESHAETEIVADFGAIRNFVAPLSHCNSRGPWYFDRTSRFDDSLSELNNDDSVSERDSVFSQDRRSRLSDIETNTGSPDVIHSFYDLSENPEVPDVDGLNSIASDDYSPHDDMPETDMVQTDAMYGRIEEEEKEICTEDDDTRWIESDEWAFSQKEVAFLLLAHDVAQASRRNSRRCERYADTVPGPLVTMSRAHLIQGLFGSAEIMEMTSVISFFQFLQRWTVCYPYRLGSLEAPVRRFVQSPLAHDLCVGAVGQRYSAKSFTSSRTQHCRSSRAPPTR